MRNDGVEPITTAQAATILRLTVATVNKHAASGRIPFVQKLPGRTGAYLFDPAVVEAFRRQRAEPVAS